MKKLLIILTALLLALSVVGCGNKEETKKETGDKKEKVTIGTDAAFPPFELLDGGKVVGFDVDLLGAVLEEAGYEWEFKNVGWDPLFPSVKNKEITMGASAITITEERKQTYNFSHPYFESTFMILVKEGSNIKSATDLKNVNIGVQTGTTGMIAVEKLVGKNASNIKKYENNAIATMALKNGEVEAVVTDIAVAAEYVKNNPNDKIVAIADTENFASEYYGFMFNKDDAKLLEDVNAAYNKLLDNGKYAEIYKKYFGMEPNVENLKKQQ
jgi:polar amino acid transport system substrate-binding protein